jgi:altronate hydrolase
MSTKFLKIHPEDNVYVALTDLKAGEKVSQNGFSVILPHDVQAKHKFVQKALNPEDEIIMYGCVVGKALQFIPEGGVIATHNVKHKSSDFAGKTQTFQWNPPDISRWKEKSFLGFHRPDGQVGTANYWIVIPLVFCENRNVNVIRQAFEEELGQAKHSAYKSYVRELVQLYRDGKSENIPTVKLATASDQRATKLFNNIDGIKFLTHEGGCGGTRQDSEALCGLLAGYINNPNVAGATVLSLGCQNAQVDILIKPLSCAIDCAIYILNLLI